jgi:hypothetical protein
MPNITNAFRNILSPKRDFLLFFEVEDKYFKLAYEKIFSEFTSWFQKRKGLKVESCKFSLPESKIKVSGSYAYELILNFEQEDVSLEVNGQDLGTAKIYGFCLNKETLTISKIKVDLSTFKRQLSEILR